MTIMVTITMLMLFTAISQLVNKDSRRTRRKHVNKDCGGGSTAIAVKTSNNDESRLDASVVKCDGL